MNKVNLKEIVEEFYQSDLYYLPGSAAIFIADSHDQSGGNFLHFLKEIKILPAKNLIVSVHIAPRPYVAKEKFVEVEQITKRIYRIVLHYGFMEEVNIPKALRLIFSEKYLPFKLNVDKILYLIETIEVNITKKKSVGLWFWQKNIFKMLLRSSTLGVRFFHLPPTRTITIGVCCSI